MLLANLFNSTITEGILLYIFHYDGIHASAIARYLGKSLTGVLTQLDHFENAGLLVSKQVGRSRVFSFNKKSPVTRPLIEIVEMAYNSIPLEERDRMFPRRRPRRKGKPVRK